MKKLFETLEPMIVSVVICLIIIACCKVGKDVGSDRMEKKYQKELVNRGYAIYNPTNGVWQWK